MIDQSSALSMRRLHTRPRSITRCEPVTWRIDPEIAFLNHGSFGACPAAVLEHQAELRERMERRPIRYFMSEMLPAIDDARRAVALFVGADP